ncbi:hypothetical protein P0082_06030 [Candidatus Haliotispira prima]|uniref:DUF4249 family protein n=1 Tax=Candidatus Haliotispira prima TaxID=3034016 RepID=A0ABY8MDI3_9SPIO|nr:hypothetical protein P0082_06030 [Candidatus Haliotispira prima]
MFLSGCAPISDDSKNPTPPAAASLNTSMAWVSMREALVQLDNGSQGVRTIGVVVSKDATATAYASVKDLPGFYTRKTKADGTPRTVYLSMTDQMTFAKFNLATVSVNGQVSALAAAPEILHPGTKYYAHFYEIAGTTGTAIEKLEFTTESFPSSYPTARGTYSSFYNQITAGITSTAMEYKASESYLIPVRVYFSFIPVTLTFGDVGITYDIHLNSGSMRPFRNRMISTHTEGILYDIYNINPSGPDANVTLWDGMIKTPNLSSIVAIDSGYGGQEFIFYDNKKVVLVTE